MSLATLPAETPLRILHAGLARSAETHDIPLHHHPFFQLEVITRGAALVVFDGADHEVRTGMATFFRPFHSHGERPHPRARCVDNLHVKFDAQATWLPYLQCPVLGRFSHAPALRRIIQQWLKGSPLDKIKAQMDLARLFLGLAETTRASGRAAITPSDPWLSDVLEFVEAHVAGVLTVALLARQFHMSPDHFTRRFREKMGLPPLPYIQRVRCEKALRMLEQGLACKEVALRLGFGSVAHFSRSFKRVQRVPPSLWWKALHEPGSSTVPVLQLNRRSHI